MRKPAFILKGQLCNLWSLPGTQVLKNLRNIEITNHTKKFYTWLGLNESIIFLRIQNKIKFEFLNGSEKKTLLLPTKKIWTTPLMTSFRP